MSFHITEAKVSKPCQIPIKLDTTQNPGTYELEPETGCISCYNTQKHMAQPNASPSTLGVTTEVVVKVEGAAALRPQPLLGADQQGGISVQFTVPWNQHAFSVCVQVQDYKYI